ncbi:MAG: DUF72 domain-containing protein [Caldimonas sp.]
MAKSAAVRVGVGGWTFAPWRNNFFPEGLPQHQELVYASSHLSTIEIYGTYYRTQKPESFAKWRDETPPGFVFSVKASRYATNQRVLAQAGESIERFVGSGLAELGPKLGPIVWQFMPTKRFDAEDFGAFLDLLPKEVQGLPLRHAMDVRHPSFMADEYLALARKHGVATVFADSDDYPSFADITGDFVYGRLMRTQSGLASGYPEGDLDRWKIRADEWASGREPDDLPKVEVTGSSAARTKARDVFLYFISGAKERAPAAAIALLERVHA